MKILRIALYCLLLMLTGLAGFAVGVLTLGGYSPNMLLEVACGETPQARITTYLRAVEAQDRAAALDAWWLSAAGSGTFTGLVDRRDRVTDELLAHQITGFTIFEPEWWSTCCDPGVICDARNAGGARVHVQVLDKLGQPWSYTFDDFVDGVYFGEAAGNEYRRWILRDVYPRGDLPIYWRLVYTEEIH